MTLSQCTLPAANRSWDSQYLGGPVILIDEDTPSDELANRLQRLTIGLGLSLGSLPIEVHSMEDINLSDGKALQKLESEVADTKSVLVILDCLSKVMGGEFNEDSAKDANRAGDIWNRLKANGATVFVVHHLNKREGNLATDFVRLSRGSGALVSSSDTAFGIEFGRRNPTRFIVSPIERRRKLSIREPFGIELEEDEAGTWARLKRADATREVSDLAKGIFEIVFRPSRGEGKTAKYVRAMLAGAASDADIREALHELELSGIIGHTTSAHNLFVYSYPPPHKS